MKILKILALVLMTLAAIVAPLMFDFTDPAAGGPGVNLSSHALHVLRSYYLHESPVRDAGNIETREAALRLVRETLDRSDNAAIIMETYRRYCLERNIAEGDDLEKTTSTLATRWL